MRRGAAEQLVLGHRRIGGAEEDEQVGELPDAAARANRLIVDPEVGLRLRVFGEPGGVDRIRKRGAGAGDLDGLCRRSGRTPRQRRRGNEGDGGRPSQEQRVTVTALGPDSSEIDEHMDREPLLVRRRRREAAIADQFVVEQEAQR